MGGMGGYSDFEDIRIVESKAGYYCAAFDEHDVYDLFRPALALPMKRAIPMKATHVSKIAKVVSDVT
eukprot:16074473-Heterocapsa_arctica.AAC.1